MLKLKGCRLTEINEVDNKMKQIAIRPEPKVGFYNFIRPQQIEVAIAVPPNLQQRKYKEALKITYDKVPEILRNTDNLIPKLFAKGIISKSEKEKLKASLKIEGTEKHNELLLDFLLDKTEDTIEEFLQVLEEIGQKQLADWIKDVADDIQEKIYKTGILSQGQAICEIGKHSLPTREAIQKSSSLDRDSQSTLDMVLSTVPNPEPTQIPCVGQSGHLIVGFTVKQGAEEIVNQVKHSFFKMKSEFTKKMKMHCQCHVSDQRLMHEKNEGCSALVSVEFQAGEKEAYQILEEKLLDFESYVYGHKGILLTVEEGCIKLKIKVHDRAHLISLEEDIRCGKVLSNMVSWLEKEGYQGSDDRPMFMLVVDDDQIHHLKEYLKEADTDPILQFPVSYTYCPHQNKWMWSADKTHWDDITQQVVQEGYYKGKTVGQTDCMILEYLAENPAVKPETVPEVCIACCFQNEKETNTKTDNEDDICTKNPKSIEESAVKTKEARRSIENNLPYQIAFDRVSNLGLQGLSFIFHEIVDSCVCKNGINDLKHLVQNELQRTFKSFLNETKSALEFSGDLFDGAGLPFFDTQNVTCFFTAAENTIGYQEDIDEGIQSVITEDDDQPVYLKLKPIEWSSGTELLNSKNTMIQFIEGLNLLVKENTDVNLIKIEIPVDMQKVNADIHKPTSGPSWDESKTRNETPMDTKEVNDYDKRPTKESTRVENKKRKSQKPLPKLRGCFIRQQQITSSVTPTLQGISVQCQHVNIPLDCNVNLAYISRSWPSCAAEWILRPRPFGWPSNKLVDDILTEGCRVIPANEPENQFLWKFNFDNAERKIIQCLPEIYRDILTLLYALCHDSFLAFGLPTPYQVKTLFLWACEKNGIENISKEHSTHFLLLVLDDIISKLQAKHLPQYFIKDINLFSGFENKQLDNAKWILTRVRSNPLGAVFTFAEKFHEMPQKKPLEVLFKPVISHDMSMLSKNAEHECLTLLFLQLVAESKWLEAGKIFLKFPNAATKRSCLSKMKEETIMLFGSRMPIEHRILIYEYLVDTFPESKQISEYYNFLAVIYHDLLLKENDQVKQESLSTKARDMFQKALTNPSPAIKVDYAYYLYTTKSYSKAIEMVKPIIKKPLAADFTGMKWYPNFLHPSNEPKAKKNLLLWPLAFALYITVKSYQSLDKPSDAKKYLKQLKDACNRVPQLANSSTQITYSSLELLGAAAKDLREFQISTDAYEKMADLQKVELLVQAQNQATWKLIPQSPSINPNKFHFQMGNPGDKDFTCDFV